MELVKKIKIYMNFENQIAVVTGAASGIGLAIAQRLASEGLRLVLLDYDEDAVSHLKETVEGYHLAYHVAVTKEDEVKHAILGAAKIVGSPHIVVNSAGVTGATNIRSHETDTE